MWRQTVLVDTEKSVPDPCNTFVAIVVLALVLAVALLAGACWATPMLLHHAVGKESHLSYLRPRHMLMKRPYTSPSLNEVA